MTDAVWGKEMKSCSVNQRVGNVNASPIEPIVGTG